MSAIALPRRYAFSVVRMAVFGLYVLNQNYNAYEHVDILNTGVN